MYLWTDISRCKGVYFCLSKISQYIHFFFFLFNIYILDLTLCFAEESSNFTGKQGHILSRWSKYGTRSCHRICKVTWSQCSPGQDPCYRTPWWEASWPVKIWDLLCLLHPTNMLICDIQLLLPCSSPYWVPTGIMLAFIPPTNSAKSRLMHFLFLLLFLLLTHLLRAAINSAITGAAAAAAASFQTTDLAKKKGSLQTCTLLLSPQSEQSLHLPAAGKKNVLKQGLANTLPFLPCQR